MIRNSGVVLNNGMFWFNPVPGTLASIRPKKWPMSAMAPAVLLKDGKTFLSVGSPGARRVMCAVTESIINVVDYGMTIQEAINTPGWTIVASCSSSTPGSRNPQLISWRGRDTKCLGSVKTYRLSILPARLGSWWTATRSSGAESIHSSRTTQPWGTRTALGPPDTDLQQLERWGSIPISLGCLLFLFLDEAHMQMTVLPKRGKLALRLTAYPRRVKLWRTNSENPSRGENNCLVGTIGPLPCAYVTLSLAGVHHPPSRCGLQLES